MTPPNIEWITIISILMLPVVEHRLRYGQIGPSR